MKLTDMERDFLSVLAKYTKTVARRHLPLADRQEDKIRQSLRRRGLAEFGKWEGDRIMGWRITNLGRSALEQEGNRTNER